MLLLVPRTVTFLRSDQLGGSDSVLSYLLDGWNLELQRPLWSCTGQRVGLAPSSVPPSAAMVITHCPTLSGVWSPVPLPLPLFSCPTVPPVLHRTGWAGVDR